MLFIDQKLKDSVTEVKNSLFTTAIIEHAIRMQAVFDTLFDPKWLNELADHVISTPFDDSSIRPRDIVYATDQHLDRTESHMIC